MGRQFAEALGQNFSPIKFWLGELNLHISERRAMRPQNKAIWRSPQTLQRRKPNKITGPKPAVTQPFGPRPRPIRPIRLVDYADATDRVSRPRTWRRSASAWGPGRCPAQLRRHIGLWTQGFVAQSLIFLSFFVFFSEGRTVFAL